MHEIFKLLNNPPNYSDYSSVTTYILPFLKPHALRVTTTHLFSLSLSAGLGWKGREGRGGGRVGSLRSGLGGSAPRPVKVVRAPQCPCGSEATAGFPCLALTGGDLAARRSVRSPACVQRPGAGLDGRWPAGISAVEGSTAEVQRAPAPVIAKSRQSEEWRQCLLLQLTAHGQGGHRGSRRCGQSVPRGRDGRPDAGGLGDRPAAVSDLPELRVRSPAVVRARGFARSGAAGRR